MLWHFSVAVSDLDAAVGFYVDLLGCTWVATQQQPDTGVRTPGAVLRTAQLRIGESTLASGHHLELVEYVCPQWDCVPMGITHPGTRLAFAVADLDAEYARLTAHGVRFLSPPDAGPAGVRKACFRGPDDILHELVQEPGSACQSSHVPERLARAMREARVRLADPALAPPAVADACHISVRQLHRDFAEEGTTFGAWLRDERLSRCRAELTDPAMAGVLIADIARRWGFRGQAYFSRLFVQTYSVTPREARRRALRG
jgi:AraC-like DNA-binding protein/catechol 2,3-dioxygenase-like lactoylglutathione lyase family enzyme